MTALDMNSCRIHKQTFSILGRALSKVENLHLDILLWKSSIAIVIFYHLYLILFDRKYLAMPQKVFFDFFKYEPEYSIQIKYSYSYTKDLIEAKHRCDLCDARI